MVFIGSKLNKILQDSILLHGHHSKTSPSFTIATWDSYMCISQWQVNFEVQSYAVITWKTDRGVMSFK